MTGTDGETCNSSLVSPSRERHLVERLSLPHVLSLEVGAGAVGFDGEPGKDRAEAAGDHASAITQVAVRAGEGRRGRRGRRRRIGRRIGRGEEESRRGGIADRGGGREERVGGGNGEGEEDEEGEEEHEK